MESIETTDIDVVELAEQFAAAKANSSTQRAQMNETKERVAELLEESGETELKVGNTLFKFRETPGPVKFQDALDKTLKEHYAFTDEDLDELDELLKTTKSEMAVPRRILSVRTIKPKRRRKRANSDDETEQEIEPMDDVPIADAGADVGMTRPLAPAITAGPDLKTESTFRPQLPGWDGPVIHLRTLDGGMQAIPLFSESYLAAQRSGGTSMSIDVGPPIITPSASAFPPQIALSSAPPLSAPIVSASPLITPPLTHITDTSRHMSSVERDRQPRKRIKTNENSLTERKRSISQPRMMAQERAQDHHQGRRPKTPGPRPTPLNLYDRPMDLERSGDLMPAKPEVPFDPNALLRVQTALRNFMS